MTKTFNTAWLLAGFYGVAASATPMMMLLGSIIGAEMAPSQRWATLPITLMIVGIAAGVVPATRCMRKYGRRNTFALFVGLGALACLLASAALAVQSFGLFCAASVLLGSSGAALQQSRFAAMESVTLDKAPTAASILMCAGILAAIIGPELALTGKTLTAVDYQGSFLLGAGCMLMGGVLLLFYRAAPIPEQTQAQQERSTADSSRNSRQ